MKAGLLVSMALVLLAGCGEGQQPISRSSPTAPILAPAEPEPEVVVIEVPDVSARSLASATRIIERTGLQVLTAEKYSQARPESILSQTPAPGTSVDEGSVINLSVAQPFPRIPNVTGVKGKLAERRLEQAGYSVKSRQETSSQPNGTVLSQSPEAGFEARPGRTVTIVLAKAAPEPKVESQDGNCTPGYSPCLPIASDYDCAGGSGDGPKYTGYVTVTGSDPYGLDSDGNGAGCESS